MAVDVITIVDAITIMIADVITHLVQIAATQDVAVN